MNTINKIGLEAEFFLRNSKNQLVYPSDYGFGSDDFPIVGEFRAEAGDTRQDTIANFLKSYYEVVFKAKTAGLKLDIKTGWASVTLAFHAEVMRRMGHKDIAKCKNIDDIDILTQSDDKIENGKVVEKRLSAGLHVHFSSEAVDTYKYPVTKNINLRQLYGTEQEKADIYRMLSLSAEERSVTVRASRITKPIIKLFVKSFDDNILKSYTDKLPILKYRLPGFYENKAYGFEYRSLPFNQSVLDSIDKIVDHSFGLLESL